MLKSKALPAAVLASLMITIMPAFQNCSLTQFGGGEKPSTEAQGSGTNGGFDGKVFNHLASCDGGQTTGIESTIALSNDGKQAILKREFCHDLTTPAAVDVANIDKSALQLKMIVYKNKIFDQENGSPLARLTRVFCSTPGSDTIQISVWLNEVGALFSDVTFSTSVNSISPTDTYKMIEAQPPASPFIAEYKAEIPSTQNSFRTIYRLSIEKQQSALLNYFDPTRGAAITVPLTCVISLTNGIR